jgi:hypothetical protein
MKLPNHAESSASFAMLRNSRTGPRNDCGFSVGFQVLTWQVSVKG